MDESWKTIQEIYKSLPLGEDQIRILTLHGSNDREAQIRCTLRTASLKGTTKPLYKALSYTWGKGKGKVIRIDAKNANGESVNGKSAVEAQTYTPGANLYGALQHFREREKGSDIEIWIDAICINQKPQNPDKLTQISLMREIFSTATETLVWLGPKEAESDKAMSLIKRISQVLKLQDPGPKYTETTRLDFPKTWGSGIKSELLALENLFIRDYWYRVWIVQEIAVSKVVTLFCGDDSASWEEIFDAAYFVDGGVGVKDFIYEQRLVPCGSTSAKGRSIGRSSAGSRNIHAGIQRIVSIQSVRNDIQKASRSDEDLKMEPPDSLLFLLSNHRSTDSTCAIDKYRALAGLVIDRPPPLPTNNVKDVYVWSALSIANQQQSCVKSGLCLDFLDCAGRPVTGPFMKRQKAANMVLLELPEEEFPELPSWVPDWSFYQTRASPLLHWQFSGKNDSSKVYFDAPGNVTTKGGPSIKHSVFTAKLLVHPCIQTSQIHPLVAERRMGTENLTEDILSARGVQLDEISGVGFSEWDPPDTREIQNGLDPQGIPDGIAYKDVKDIVWKTCILNRTARGQTPPSQWRKLFYDYIRSQQWYKNNKTFKICGYTLEQITISAGEKQGDTLNTGPVTGNKGVEVAGNSSVSKSDSESIDLLSMAFRIATGKRRLASTKLGYLCMAPFSAHIGDRIVVLYDCHAPVVLRKEENQDFYVFIGTCYVHGIMGGEVAGMRGLDSKWFDIK